MCYGIIEVYTLNTLF